MSRRMTHSAQWPNCDGPRQCRGTHGKSALRRRCGCHARAMSSCCMAVCAPGKAPTKSLVANGVSLFLEISFDCQRDRSAASACQISYGYPTSSTRCCPNSGRLWVSLPRLTRRIRDHRDDRTCLNHLGQAFLSFAAATTRSPAASASHRGRPSRF
jgi:hypothetical protein